MFTCLCEAFVIEDEFYSREESEVAWLVVPAVVCNVLSVDLLATVCLRTLLN